MARNAKSPNAVQTFRGGRNRLGVWEQFAKGACCDPGVTLDFDRLPPTVQWENANIHTNPLGGRNPTWRFSQLNQNDQRNVIDKINAVGVGAIIEAHVIPTFAFVTAVAVVAFKEEPGLLFEVITRNGTALPTDQLIRIAESDAAAGCGGPTRVQGAANLASVGEVGAGVSRVYDIAVDGNGGKFALEADVLALRVISMPARGKVEGLFDLAVELSYTSAVRSEAN